MSVHPDLHPSHSAALSTARRHESGARWTEAARAYLNVLVSHQELEEISLSGLERCARQTQRTPHPDPITSETSEHELLNRAEGEERTGDVFQLPQILLLVGYALCGRWRQTFQLLEGDDLEPQLLSPSISRRWPHLYARLREEASSLDQSQGASSHATSVEWIVLLAALDLIARRGYVNEALMMCQHALDHLQEPLYQAILHYEAGRIGINHGCYASGALALRASLRLSPSLRDDVAETLDRAICADHNLDDQLDDLISLRCSELSLDLIESWVGEVAEYSSVHRAEFILWLGERLERLSPISGGVLGTREISMRSAAFQCYAITLNETPIGTPLQVKSFDHLTRLALARLGVQAPQELEDDEPTLDTDDDLGSSALKRQGARELVEEAESRLLIQLKDLQAFSLIEQFLERKANAHHLTQSERASAFNALAQIAFSARKQLQEAVEFVWQGAQLSPQEMRISPLLREAQRIDDWLSLKRLLRVQLKLSHEHEKRRTLLRALAQGYRRERSWFNAYDCLIEAGWEQQRGEGILEAESRDTMLTLSLSEKSEREIASLLRVKGAALSIGDELSLAGQWPELLRLIERLQTRGAVARELLVRGVQSRESWRFAQPLLDLYRSEERWDHWVNLILSAPRESWTIDEWGPLIEDALSHSVNWAPELRTRLLKVRAEWFREEGAPLAEQLAGWRAYLNEHPADLNALEEFELCAAQLDAWSEVAIAYERALPIRKTGKQRILERLAEIHEQQLGQLEEAMQFWRALLELAPHHEEAGSWLTLHYARQRDWYHVLLICALWSPKNELHPVWIESKVRGHLGLEELNEAYFWWTQLESAQKQAPFVFELIHLAERSRAGERIIELLDLIDHAFSDHLDASLFDTSTSDIFSSLNDTLGSEAERSESEDDFNLLDQTDIAVSGLSKQKMRRLRARALTWLSPRDEIESLRVWEEVARDQPRDSEVIIELARGYARTHQPKALIRHLSLIEEGREVVLAHRAMIMESALYLETRFQEYTEAFKCWLALYEHSPSDRPRSLIAFERLADSDVDLISLLQELYRVLASHASSPRMRGDLLLKVVRMCEPHPHYWEAGYAALSDLIKLGTDDSLTARDLLSRYVTPLARWREVAELVAKRNDWRAKRLAGEIMETREGDHQAALRYYQEACQYCEQAQTVRVAPYRADALRELQRSLDRVSRALRRRGPTPPSMSTPPKLKLLPPLPSPTPEPALHVSTPVPSSPDEQVKTSVESELSSSLQTPQDQAVLHSLGVLEMEEMNTFNASEPNPERVVAPSIEETGDVEPSQDVSTKEREPARLEVDDSSDADPISERPELKSPALDDPALDDPALDDPALDDPALDDLASPLGSNELNDSSDLPIESPSPPERDLHEEAKNTSPEIIIFEFSEPPLSAEPELIDEGVSDEHESAPPLKHEADQAD